MGCASSTPMLDDASSHSRSIDLSLQKEKNRFNVLRLLFLGTGEGGKSTILNQFELISGRQYTYDDRMEYKHVIWSNTIQSMQACLEAIPLLGIELPEELEDAAAKLLHLNTPPSNLDDHTTLPPLIVDALLHIIDSSTLHLVIRQSHRFQLNDSAEYFFENAERITDPDYLPTDQDILRSRIKSTGIKEVKFKSGPLNINAIDVGGQRSERRKWLNVFEGIDVVIFVAAISEFNQVLYEDGETNRMQESLILWESIINSVWFKKSTSILFLNKVDLFKEKLLRFQIKDYMPEFDGPNTFEAASQFLLHQYLDRCKDPQCTVHGHFTCATDRQQTSVVLQAVVDHLLTQNLQSVGIF